MNSTNEDSSGSHDEFLRLLSIEKANSEVRADEVIESVIVKALNSRLNQASTRSNGLEQLNHFLPRCQDDLLQRHSTFWIAKAIQELETIEGDSRRSSVAHKTLASLAARCNHVPECRKFVSMQCIKQILNVLTNSTTGTNSGSAYYLLAVLLHYYPESCEKSSVQIRKMILPLVDASRSHLVVAGARCHLLLCNATERSFKSTKSMSGQLHSQTLICNSLHEVMSELFVGLVELETDAETTDKLDIPKISENDVVKRYNDLERRFVNLCLFLKVMLDNSVREHNLTCPKTIFKLLCRGLAVTPMVKNTGSDVKSKLLPQILPKLHVALLSVLEGLVNSFGVELIAQTSLVYQLLEQTFKWTEELPIEEEIYDLTKDITNVRIAVYNCLHSWFENVGSSSGFELVSEEFTKHFLNDIVPQRSTVRLVIQSSQHLSRRAQKKLKGQQPEENNKQSSLSTTRINVELCSAALVALEGALNASVFLKSTILKNIQCSVLGLLNECYLEPSEVTYFTSNVECRLNLLRVLKSIQINRFSTPPPTNHTIQVAQMAINDSNLEIRQEAKLLLAHLAKVVYPSAPSLEKPFVEEENGFAAEDQDVEMRGYC